MIEAFPLSWPLGLNRTEQGKRKRSTFKVTQDQARKDIQYEIIRLGGKDMVISTNMPIRRDGMPYAGNYKIEDPGCAVYFNWNNDTRVIAADQYESLRENMHAIALTIEAMRGIERWGCSDILNRMFTGLKMLPENSTTLGWWEVLHCERNSSMDSVEFKYKMLLKKYHPDNPVSGDADKFDSVQKAFTAAQNEIHSRK